MKICVTGLGYVGSVVAAGLAIAEHDVIGVDVGQEKVDGYRHGPIPIYEPALPPLIQAACNSGKLRILHTSEVSEPLGDVIFITTGTPTSEGGAADLSQVRSALAWIKERQPEGGFLVMKSTVPPGTGVRLLGSVLQDTGFDYISNPEFLREGQAVSDWFHPDRIVIGNYPRIARA